MKKLFLASMATTLLAMAGAAFAGTDTNSIQVLANVPPVCRITTAATDVDFGTYDPTLDADDTDGTSSVSFRCVKGTTYWTYIARANTMTAGTESLTYELYTDAARTTVWDASKTGVGNSSASNAVQTIDIYGKIPKLQDVGAGSYSESVTVTVEY
ncbi:MAG: spore coat U domain-containing protein [Nitrospirota bacterium]|nr:spore coat U domain-containing protein [Nitrospirota bacterium]